MKFSKLQLTFIDYAIGALDKTYLTLLIILQKRLNLVFQFIYFLLICINYFLDFTPTRRLRYRRRPRQNQVKNMFYISFLL